MKSITKAITTAGLILALTLPANAHTHLDDRELGIGAYQEQACNQRPEDEDSAINLFADIA